MIPFVRRVAEAERVLAQMAELGLRRGENGLEVYAMCEIPNNVLLIDQFAEAVRRLLDRLERPHPAHPRRRPRLGDRRLRLRRARRGRQADDPAGRRGLRRNGIHSGLCGQAPSDYPDMAEYLVELGIDSISLNPDTVIKTTRSGVLDLEGRLAIGADGSAPARNRGHRVAAR